MDNARIEKNLMKAILNKDVIISKFQEPMKTKQCTRKLQVHQINPFKIQVSQLRNCDKNVVEVFGTKGSYT